MTGLRKALLGGENAMTEKLIASKNGKENTVYLMIFGSRTTTPFFFNKDEIRKNTRIKAAIGLAGADPNSRKRAAPKIHPSFGKIKKSRQNK